MNKRIQELAEQAEAHYRANVLGASMYKTPPAGLMEKFAELIVEECIEQASTGNMHGNNQWDKALTFAVDNIKKHFGVER